MKNNIAFCMNRQDEQINFVFYGVSKQVVSKVFRNMSGFYIGCHIAEENAANIHNGKCHQHIVATISEPRTDILPEKEWPMMIERFLHKLMACEVTYFDDIEKLLNV